MFECGKSGDVFYIDSWSNLIDSDSWLLSTTTSHSLTSYLSMSLNQCSQKRQLDPLQLFNLVHFFAVFQQYTSNASTLIIYHYILNMMTQRRIDTVKVLY